MRITNIEKFRNELYEAIRDTCEWTVDTPSAIFKSGVEYKDSMKEYNHSAIIDGTPRTISLACPMQIEMTCPMQGELYITVDKDAVSFWKSEDGCFDFDGYIEFELYRNKMSFIAALVLRIANKLEK